MKPKIIIPNDILTKVRYWVHKAGKDEISGLGNVVFDDAGNVRVVSAILCPQKNGSTITDIEAQDVCNAMYTMKDTPGELKWWWHSHVDMSVFWSGTDVDTIKKFGQAGWITATVFNKKNEQKSAYFSPDGIQYPWGKSPLYWEDIDTVLETEAHPDIPKWDEEFTKNILPNYPVVSYPAYGGNEYWGYPAINTVRPVGMSKKEWKAIKRGVVENDYTTIDVYGFTQGERSEISAEGFDQGDIDILKNMGFSSANILEIVRGGMTMYEVMAFKEEGYTLDKILAEANWGKWGSYYE